MINVWSMYDQCMINVWHVHWCLPISTCVLQRLDSPCHWTMFQRHSQVHFQVCCGPGSGKSNSRSFSVFFWFSLTPLALRKPSNQVPPNSDFLGACTFRPKPNLFEGKRNHQHSYCSTIAVAAKVWFQIWRLGPVGCVSFLTCTFDALCICVLEFCLIVCFQQVTSQSNCRPNLCISCVSEFPLSVFL